MTRFYVQLLRTAQNVYLWMKFVKARSQLALMSESQELLGSLLERLEAAHVLPVADDAEALPCGRHDTTEHNLLHPPSTPPLPVKHVSNFVSIRPILLMYMGRFFF